MSFMAAVIYVSDQLEILCGKLAQQIDRMDYPSADADTIFLPEVLITQTAGMESWLSTELTRQFPLHETGPAAGRGICRTLREEALYDQHTPCYL